MSRSLKVRQQCIEKVNQSVQRNGFVNQRALAEDVGMALATVGNFLRGKPVDRATFIELCEKLSLDYQEIADMGQQLLADPIESDLPIAHPIGLSSNPGHCSWGEAVEIEHFQGRESELEQLQQWVVRDGCRLVALVGMGGIGKTALAIQVARLVQEEFEGVVWRSLRNAPPIEDLLVDLLQFLLGSRSGAVSRTVDGKISQLMEVLRSRRCLLVLDNAESILEMGERAGSYRSGYQGYGQLLRSISEVSHRSCAIVTSREKPRNLGAKEGLHSPVKSCGCGMRGTVCRCCGWRVPMRECGLLGWWV
jgi:NB-ARC domain